MNDTIEIIIEGLLAQKEKLEATIEELNSLEAEYSKDTKIINDRLDNLVLKDKEILDKFRQDLDGINEAISALQAVSIDLSPYATLDDVRQAISDIKIPDMPKAIKGDKGDPGKNAEIDYSIVEAQIKQFILSNRDKFKGKDGETPTNDEIQSIVNQWLNENKESLKGEKGDTITPKDGKDGIGIKSITYKNNTIYITLTDDTKKEFKLPTQYVGGGGISAAYVHNAINEALSGGGGGSSYQSDGIFSSDIIVNGKPLGRGSGNSATVLSWGLGNLSAYLGYSDPGGYICSIGDGCLHSLQTGWSLNAIGTDVAYNATHATDTQMQGNNVFWNAQTIEGCTAIGSWNGYSAQNPVWCTFIGEHVAMQGAIQQYNTFVGAYAGDGFSGIHSGALGFLATPTSNYQIRIGKGDVSVSATDVVLTSDANDKLDIESLPEALCLEIVKRLNPVSYRRNARSLYRKVVEYTDAEGRKRYKTEKNREGRE